MVANVTAPTRFVCDSPDRARRAESGGLDPSFLVIFTEPRQGVEIIKEYAEAGGSRLFPQVPDLSDLTHVEPVAAQVAPQL
jgi:hypothetical protein